MSSRFGYVTVKKQGYFTGSRSILTNAGSSNYVSIQLIPRVSKGSFASATGGTIKVQTGDTVTFAGSSVVTAATNGTYTGDVHVYAAYLDPTDANVFKYMPGDLRGIGLDGKETGLQSFGMMVVELEGDAGEKLQIAASQKATLSWAIPASLQATAPTTMRCSSNINVGFHTAYKGWRPIRGPTQSTLPRQIPTLDFWRFHPLVNFPPSSIADRQISTCATPLTAQLSMTFLLPVSLVWPGAFWVAGQSIQTSRHVLALPSM